MAKLGERMSEIEVFSVIVNACPTTEFSVNHGLRKGGPISSFLFTLVMEGINQAICKVVENGSYKDIGVGEDKILLTHIFMHMTRCFSGNGRWRIPLMLFTILFYFQRLMGHKVNQDKSSLIGIGG